MNSHLDSASCEVRSYELKLSESFNYNRVQEGAQMAAGCAKALVLLLFFDLAKVGYVPLSTTVWTHSRRA